jgi:hypothetical protein
MVSLGMGKNFEDINKETEVLQQGWTRVAKKLRESKNNINLSFVEGDVKDTIECENQILVQYKNGRFELLPHGVTGFQIKDYLGIRYFRIAKWTVMPYPNGSKRDIYDF